MILLKDVYRDIIFWSIVADSLRGCWKLQAIAASGAVKHKDIEALVKKHFKSCQQIQMLSPRWLCGQSKWGSWSKIDGDGMCMG